MNPNEHEPGQDDDIFPPSIQPNAAPKPGPDRPAGTGQVVKRSPIKPAYVFGAAAVVVMFWAFGVPMLSSNKPPHETTVSSDRDPELPTYTRRHIPQAASDTALSNAPADDPFAQPASPAAAPAPAASHVAMLASAPTTNTEVSTVVVGSEPTNAEQVAALKTQVANLELALRDHPTCAATSHGPTTHAGGALRPRHKATPARPALEEATTSDLGILSGYRLNTIYRGQAWIEHAQKTYVVEAGQDFDGLKVIRVDAQARRVVTAQGEIR